MIVLITFVLTLLVTIISLIYYKLTFWSRRGIPNDLSSRSDTPFHISELKSHQKYGKVVGFYEGLNPCLSITDPQIIKKILVTEFNKFANRRQLVGVNEPLFWSLFFTQYTKWKRIRTILSPSFSTGKLNLLKPSIVSSLNKLIEKLSIKSKNNEIIDLRYYFDGFTFDVISKLAFGLDLDILNNPDNFVFESAKELLRTRQTLTKFLVFVFPFLTKYFDYLFIDKKSQNTIAFVVKQVIDERIANNIEVTDLLQQTIDSSQLSNKFKSFQNSFEKMTEKEIIGQSINILAAGYETTSTQLCFIFRFLALNPEYDKPLLDEIHSTFESESDISYEKLLKMVYLDAFVKEIMRINCSVNRIDRKTTTECLINNISIPKDTTIVIPIWALHLDPDNFEEPHVFNPDRFLPENEKLIKDYTYMPFATGPRNCIGMRLALMEIKYTMVVLLRKFRIEACDQTEELTFNRFQQVANMHHAYLRFIERN